MRPAWLHHLLRCPRCGGFLTATRRLEGAGPLTGGTAGMPSSGELRCNQCGMAYAVRRAIPRFVAGEAHAASFGRQWNRYRVQQIEEDERTFVAKTGVPLAELRGLRVLDAGCGGGRYSFVAGRAGGRVVGVDISSAVEMAARLCRDLPNVAILQADLKRLPLAPGSFDFVFSIGVLHHDRDPAAAFRSVARMVRPGGRLAVWVYRRNQAWQEGINRFLRGMTTRLPPERLEQLCRAGASLGGVPIANRLLNKLVNFSNHPVWENRLCDTFDWYSPTYQYHHTIDEVCGWFRAAGFGDLRVLPPEKDGRWYRWAYEHNLIIGSGVNVLGLRGS